MYLAKTSWISILKFPAIAGALLLLPNLPLRAESVEFETPTVTSESLEQIERYSNEEYNNSIGQGVEGASKFRDVSPSDWAYQALNDLIIRYDCLVGYPDGTFRGNRALSRYEFAAGLNACLNQIERLIAAATADFVTREDLETLRRLMQEFETELASLGTRVDSLEARTAFLEDHQFSTTTKLKGEVIFSLSDAWGGQTDNVQTVFQNRTRLNFLTSFTGKDQLQVRLQAGNVAPLLPGGNIIFDDGTSATQEGRFTYDGPVGNNVVLDILRYRFPIGNKINVQIIANNGLHHYYVDTVNPYFEGLAGGSNAISRFAERNPIYRIGPFGAGAAIAIKPIDKLRLDFGYISNEAEDAGPGAGLFNGNYSAIAQAVYGDRFKVGLTYVHAYDGTMASDFPSRFVLGGTGTIFANLAPAALASITGLPAATMNTPVASNSYGIETSLQITPNIIFNGWVGLTNARLIGLGDANIWNFAGGLALPDLGKEGNLGGVFFGAAPTLRGLRTPGNRNFSRDFAYHFEAFYRHQIHKNISITPGVIWLLNPNQNSNNSDAVIGTLRTTFTF
ncbi:carbohydrate porin [Lusitaniella coriacea LEGE 07157]|uniref:Carbohydrate porin n=1 Tax=Lusitaniella coriacea LEGE 07157 TaxID=945747 RepID=A0A8J7E0K9_9CYAN|nr:iron uptake porin [Lusitaniella coriacea]MBE9118913.1 carbohydrate porin [Lusitaniella coriacea LEGE 07157]